MQRRLRAWWTGPLRAWVAPALTCCLAILCVLAAGLLWQQRRTWPARAVLPLADPLANLNQWGANVDLTQYGPAELEEALDRIQGAGLYWVRQRFGWEQIEPQPGEWNWPAWDRIVAACAARDLRLIAVLDGAPAWARPDTPADQVLTPPREAADWGAFAAQLAARYRGQIAAYQLWDEPNLAEHWGGQYVDPAAYVVLLREGAIRVREADPGVPILLAALAPNVEAGPLNLNEVAFLRGVVGVGGAPFFDLVAVQPYGFAQPPDARPAPEQLNFRRAELIRAELVRLGLGERPLWATAGGWFALPPDWAGEPGSWPSVGAAQQAAYTLAAGEQVRAGWPWLGPLILYTLQPNLPPADPHWGFALLDPDGLPGPLYEQLAEYTAVRRVLHSGLYRPGPDTAQVSGAWRFSAAGADPPLGAGSPSDPSAGEQQGEDARLAFAMQGSALDLTVRRGPFWGVLYVTIDGRPARGLPHDEQGRAYLVLYDPAGRVETVTVADGLARGETHTVEIAAHGGWGQWPLVSWTVYNVQPPPPGAGEVWTMGLLAAGAAAAAVVQVVTNPEAGRPLHAALRSAFRRYRALPEWAPALLTLGAGLAFYLLPGPAALLLLPVLLALFFLRIDLGLAAVALALPWYLRPKVLLGRPFSPVELGLALCAAAWLLARLLEFKPAHLVPGAGRLSAAAARWWAAWTVLDKAVLALVIVAALAASWAPQRAVALREFRTVFLESALWYALLRLAARSGRAQRRVLEGWLLGALVIALLGIGQLLAGQNLIAAEGVWRVRALYGSPNNLALYLERALPVLLAVAWLGRGRVRRIAYALAALPVAAALLMTLSKGALLIGIPAALLALGLAQRRRRAVWVMAGAVLIVALLIVALLVLPLGLAERFRAVLNLRAGTAFIRLKLWRATLSMIADHPLTGVGLDNFLYAYRSRYVLPSASGELNLSHPHNLVLDTWTRLGLAGLAVLGWLLIAFFQSVWRQLRTAVDARRAELVGLFAAVVGALAHGMVDHAVFLIDLAFVLLLILALAHPPQAQGARHDR